MEYYDITTYHKHGKAYGSIISNRDELLDHLHYPWELKVRLRSKPSAWMTRVTYPFIYIEWVFVEPEYRQKGRGSKILKKFFKQCKKAGYGYCILEPIPSDLGIDDQILQAFYEKNGFVKLTRTRHKTILGRKI